MLDAPVRRSKSTFFSQAMNAPVDKSKKVIDYIEEENEKEREKEEERRLLRTAQQSSSRTKQKPMTAQEKTDQLSGRDLRRKPSKQPSKLRKKSKGLSPPKESPMRMIDDEDEKANVGDFDNTQWERTRWGEMYSTYTASQGRTPQKTIEEKKSNTVMNTAVGTTVPGEAGQIEQVRGEHLKDRPKFQLIVLGIDSAFCAITMSVWGGAADNPFLSFLLTLINLLFVFSILCGLFAVELCRFQVKKQERDEEVGNKTQHMTKYQIPYRWRFWLLGGHVARAILLCACITIMALDNDFDGGSIAVLAIQPFYLIIVSLQIFVILRPKRKE